MDALFAAVLAILLIALIGLALRILAGTWPPSSHAGGFARWDDSAGGPSLQGGPTVPEDDDVHWDWDGEDGRADDGEPSRAAPDGTVTDRSRPGSACHRAAGSGPPS